MFLLDNYIKVNQNGVFGPILKTPCGKIEANNFVYRLFVEILNLFQTFCFFDSSRLTP